MKLMVEGLVAAALTPFNDAGDVDVSVIPPLVESLESKKITGLYVCGSTGEGVSLSSQERRDVAKKYVEAAGHEQFVFVQVGHNSLEEAKHLAEDAASIGADAISATCPSYFKVGSVNSLIDCMSPIAQAASNLPFFYYHIPALTGSELNMEEFLDRGGKKIPNLAGIKYTTPKLHEFQKLLHYDSERFQVFWGTDEMLLPAWVCGAKSAIGSTYNLLAPLFHRILQSYAANDLETARHSQLKAIQIIDVLLNYPFQAALKYALFLQSEGLLQLGSARLPLSPLSEKQKHELEEDLRRLDVFNICSD